MNKKIVLLDLFEKTARKNGYEVFTPDEVANLYKEGLQKSMSNTLTPNEKEEFVADVLSIQKAICQDADGNNVVRYYRKNQLDVEYNDEGKIIKAVYADTLMNRRLNRVGAKYVPSEDIVKARYGRYEDNAKNRRLHRVGQSYGQRAERASSGMGVSQQKVHDIAKQWNKHARHQGSSMHLAQADVRTLLAGGATEEEILAANTKTKMLDLLNDVKQRSKNGGSTKEGSKPEGQKDKKVLHERIQKLETDKKAARLKADEIREKSSDLYDKGEELYDKIMAAEGAEKDKLRSLRREVLDERDSLREEFYSFIDKIKEYDTEIAALKKEIRKIKEPTASTEIGKYMQAAQGFKDYVEELREKFEKRANSSNEEVADEAEDVLEYLDDFIDEAGGIFEIGEDEDVQVVRGDIEEAITNFNDDVASLSSKIKPIKPKAFFKKYGIDW